MSGPMTAASPVADELVKELLEAASSEVSKADFLGLADRIQLALADRLLEVHGSPALAQLLALKVVNLAVARHHFEHRHTALASRPIELMLDPANNCHLACPGCVHTGNSAQAAHYDWPGGLLSPATFDRFLRELGPFAFGAVFYNYGEPLLNKKSPAMIRATKNWLLHSCVSTNFSLPIDANALIDSGLNFLFLSIDGSTQEGYAAFRRGGDLELCLSNIRKLVAARERRGSSVPYILWRFLTFEHNLHEVDDAIRCATELGVDQISITTPFAVDWDDPSIRVATSEREGIHLLRPGATFKGPLDDWRNVELPVAAIEQEFATRWASRVGGGALEEPSRKRASTCPWLYQSLTIDALGRVLPCCMAPEKTLHRVHGNYAESGDRSYNEDDYRLSRLAFADRAAFEREAGHLSAQDAPFCSICKANPEMTYTLDRDVSRDLALLDGAKSLSADTVRALTGWSVPR